MGNTVTDFATGISFLVDLKVSDDGFLYYLARGSGSVSRIGFPADSAPPTVSIDSPAGGSTVARETSITITASARDNLGGARVGFLLNGNLQCTDVSAPYSCNWRVPSPPNKNYQIQARAFDQAGNSATAAIQVTSR